MRSQSAKEANKKKAKPVENPNIIEDNIGFIGSGNMCEAVVGGLIKKKVSSKHKICSSNPSRPRLEIME